MTFFFFYLVLESVPSSFQVHVFSIGVIEAALTQFTMESNHLAVNITDLKQAERSGKIKNKNTNDLRYKSWVINYPEGGHMRNQDCCRGEQSNFVMP